MSEINEIKNSMIPNEIKEICRNCESKIHSQNKGCAFRSLGNEYCDDILIATKEWLEKDMLIKQYKECIEARLDYYGEIRDINNLLDDKIKHLNKQIKKQDKEITRLNNIINELEKYCNEVIEETKSFINTWDKAERKAIEQVLNKLKELKENMK